MTDIGHREMLKKRSKQKFLLPSITSQLEKKKTAAGKHHSSLSRGHLPVSLSWPLIGKSI